MKDNRWLSVDEIAVYLDVKHDTVYKWIDRKHKPAHKVGRLWKFRKEEVDQWVRAIVPVPERRMGKNLDETTKTRIFGKAIFA